MLDLPCLVRKGDMIHKQTIKWRNPSFLHLEHKNPLDLKTREGCYFCFYAYFMLSVAGKIRKGVRLGICSVIATPPLPRG